MQSLYPIHEETPDQNATKGLKGISNSMVPSPSSEANNRSIREEIPHLLWNQGFITDTVFTTLPMCPMMSPQIMHKESKTVCNF
jgi:hypothetical protein